MGYYARKSLKAIKKGAYSDIFIYFLTHLTSMRPTASSLLPAGALPAAAGQEPPKKTTNYVSLAAVFGIKASQIIKHPASLAQEKQNILAIQKAIGTMQFESLRKKLSISNAPQFVRKAIDSRLVSEMLGAIGIITGTFKSAQAAQHEKPNNASIPTYASIGAQLGISGFTVKSALERNPSSKRKVNAAIASAIQEMGKKAFFSSIKISTAASFVKKAIDARLMSEILLAIPNSASVPSYFSIAQDFGIHPQVLSRLVLRPKLRKQMHDAMLARISSMPQSTFLSNLRTAALPDFLRKAADARLLGIIVEKTGTLCAVPTYSSIADSLSIARETIETLTTRRKEAHSQIKNAILERIRTMDKTDFVSNLELQRAEKYVRKAIDARLLKEALIAINSFQGLPTYSSIAPLLGISNMTLSALASRNNSAKREMMQAISRRILSMPLKAFLENIKRSSIDQGIRAAMDERITKEALLAIKSSKKIPTYKSIELGLGIKGTISSLALRNRAAKEKIDAAIIRRIRSMPKKQFLQGINVSSAPDFIRNEIDARLTKEILAKIPACSPRPGIYTIARELGMAPGTIKKLMERNPDSKKQITSSISIVLEAQKAKAQQIAQRISEGFAGGLSDAELALELGIMPSEVATARRALSLYLAGPQQRAGASLRGIPTEDSALLLEHTYKQLAPFRTALSALSLIPNGAAVYENSPFPFLRLAAEFSGSKTKVRKAFGPPIRTIVIQYPFTRDAELMDAIRSLPMGGTIIISVPRKSQPDERALLNLSEHGFDPTIASVKSESSAPQQIRRKLEQTDTFVMLTKQTDAALLHCLPVPFSDKLPAGSGGVLATQIPLELVASDEQILSIQRQVQQKIFDPSAFERRWKRQFNERPTDQTRAFAARILNSEESIAARNALSRLDLRSDERVCMIELGSSVYDYSHRILPSLNIAELSAPAPVRNRILSCDSLSDAFLFRSSFEYAVSVGGWDVLTRQARSYLLSAANATLRQGGMFIIVSRQTPEFFAAKQASHGFLLSSVQQEGNFTVTTMQKVSNSGPAQLRESNLPSNMHEHLRILKLCIGRQPARSLTSRQQQNHQPANL